MAVVDVRGSLSFAFPFGRPRPPLRRAIPRAGWAAGRGGDPRRADALTDGRDREPQPVIWS